MAVATEFVGDVAVAGAVVLGGAQDKAAAKGQGLRGRGGVTEALERPALGVGEVHGR